MKGQPFHRRLAHALRGIGFTLMNERSFRTQMILGLFALAVTLWLSQSLLWLAMMTLSVLLVLAAELFNTALEHLLDGLHPGKADFVRIAKDCSAAAVLLASLAALALFLLMLIDAVWR